MAQVFQDRRQCRVDRLLNATGTPRKSALLRQFLIRPLNRINDSRPQYSDISNGITIYRLGNGDLNNDSRNTLNYEMITLSKRSLSTACQYRVSSTSITFTNRTLRRKLYSIMRAIRNDISSVIPLNVLRRRRRDVTTRAYVISGRVSMIILTIDHYPDLRYNIYDFLVQRIRKRRFNCTTFNLGRLFRLSNLLLNQAMISGCNGSIFDRLRTCNTTCTA